MMALLVESSSLNPAGPFAQRIDSLWWIYFAVLITVFVLVLATSAVALFHRRARIDSTPEMALHTGTDQKIMKWVLSATLATTVILFVMLILSVLTGHSLSAADSPEALHIKVTGSQWWWNIDYQFPVPSQNVTTANEIHIPVGRPVMVHLVSTDVIHSFWIPSLNGKRDLIPGKENLDIPLQADRLGIYRGQCAEFCGYEHAKMAFLVVAQDPEEFDRWLEEQRQPAPQPEDAQSRRGQQLFMTRTCVLCHSIHGTDAAASVAPDLTHVASRLRLAAATVPNDPQHLRDWVQNAQHIKPGVKMPSHPFSSDELDALVAYLETLK